MEQTLINYNEQKDHDLFQNIIQPAPFAEQSKTQPFLLLNISKNPSQTKHIQLKNPTFKTRMFLLQNISQTQTLSCRIFPKPKLSVAESLPNPTCPNAESSPKKPFQMQNMYFQNPACPNAEYL
jgi:hypothetical protein